VGLVIIDVMYFSSFLNLFFIPVLYVIVKTLLASFSKKKVESGSCEPEVSQAA